MQNSSPFSGVSLLIVGDFLQPPPVKQKGVFMKQSKGSCRSFNGWLWEKFQLHCMSWLRLSGRALIQILLNYLIGFEKVSKQITM